MEEWAPVRGFLGYSVSTLGRIRNDKTERIMKLGINTRGITIVGMMRDNVQAKRSVSLLVAQAFLPPPIHPSFDSVIHLDNDRTNCTLSNLMWRPHWFVVRYHRQFTSPGRRFNCKIYCPQTDEFFRNSEEMAVKYGLLESEIVAANVNGHMIWPTKFEVLVYE